MSYSISTTKFISVIFSSVFLINCQTSLDREMKKKDDKSLLIEMSSKKDEYDKEGKPHKEHYNHVMPRYKSDFIKSIQYEIEKDKKYRIEQKQIEGFEQDIEQIIKFDKFRNTNSVGLIINNYPDAEINNQLTIDQYHQLTIEDFKKILELKNHKPIKYKSIIADLRYSYLSREAKKYFPKHSKIIENRDMLRGELCMNMNYYNRRKILWGLGYLGWTLLNTLLTIEYAKDTIRWESDKCSNDNCDLYMSKEECENYTGHICNSIEIDDNVFRFFYITNISAFLTSMAINSCFICYHTSRKRCLRKICCYNSIDKVSSLEENLKKRHNRCKTLCCKVPDEANYEYGLGECCGFIEYPCKINFRKGARLGWITSILDFLCCKKNRSSNIDKYTEVEL